MAKLEKDEEKKVKKWCEAQGVLFIKFTPLGERGWPDRIAVFPGGFQMWVEMKRRGESPRALQYHRMKQLTDLGVVTCWFDNAEDCIDYFEDCLAAAEELTNERTMDTTPLPVEGNRDLDKAMWGRSTAGPRNGEDSYILSSFRRITGAGPSPQDVSGGADKAPVRDVEAGGPEVE